VQLTAEQMLSFLRSATSGKSRPATRCQQKNSTIHHAEVLDDSAIVLVTRTKDLGKGWEPIFYNATLEEPRHFLAASARNRPSEVHSELDRVGAPACQYARLN